MIYPTITAFLADAAAPARPDIPPGGSCGEKDDRHMTYLAMALRKLKSRKEQIAMLTKQAILLESFAPGDPCVERMMQWHRELTAEDIGIGA